MFNLFRLIMEYTLSFGDKDSKGKSFTEDLRVVQEIPASAEADRPFVFGRQSVAIA
jgi:hypothetical protein